MEEGRFLSIYAQSKKKKKIEPDNIFQALLEKDFSCEILQRKDKHS